MKVERFHSPVLTQDDALGWNASTPVVTVVDQSSMIDATCDYMMPTIVRDWRVLQWSMKAMEVRTIAVVVLRAYHVHM